MRMTREMAARDMSWTPETVARLSALWNEGHTCRFIADTINREFATSITRNSVIGKARRLELSSRPSPIRRDPSGDRATRIKRTAQREAMKSDSRPRTVLRRFHSSTLPPAKQCQWIEDEPSADDSCKCLGETVPGRSYCGPHDKLCWFTR